MCCIFGVVKFGSDSRYCSVFRCWLQKPTKNVINIGNYSEKYDMISETFSVTSNNFKKKRNIKLNRCLDISQSFWTVKYLFEYFVSEKLIASVTSELRKKWMDKNDTRRETIYKWYANSSAWFKCLDNYKMKIIKWMENVDIFFLQLKTVQLIW